MDMAKIYAVKNGKKPGLYNTWDECKEQVNGFSGAEFKSFSDVEEAKKYLGLESAPIKPQKEVIKERAYAFVDGSFNMSTGVYGYGGFLIDDNGTRHELSGSGNFSEMASMRNVAGEILGSTAAIKKAISLGMKNVKVYYDYAGIEQWSTGAWKRNKEGTKNYYDFIKDAEQKIKIEFVKVKGHSGIDGNEEADILAKKAVGIL